MNILAVDDIAAEGILYLEDKGFTVEQRGSLAEDELAKIIPLYNGLLMRSGSKVTKEVLRNAAGLRVIGRAGVGVDNIDLEDAAQRGILVVNAPNGNTIAAAEHTMALLLALARNVPQAHSRLCQGLWDKKGLQGIELAGKVFGILGLGKVGAAVALRALAFGMKVVGYDPNLSAKQVENMGVLPANLEETLREADFLSLHLPLTSQTRNLLGSERLGMLKPGARVINAARGGLIAEDALYDALRTGRLAGAALDVFEEEPAANHPLFSLPNVIVTPHLGASTREAQIRVALEVAEDVAAVLRGQAPRNPVNKPIILAPETPQALN